MHLTRTGVFSHLDPVKSLVYTIANTEQDLSAILHLQHENLAASLSRQELEDQGFVTVEHDLPLLRRMNSPHPHQIAKDGNAVVAYALVMLRDFRFDIPVLMPMFDQIDHLYYQGRALHTAPYVVMGQICIAKAYRGQGVFRGLYAAMGDRLRGHFDMIITEVSLRNPRSLRAHHQAGFETIHEFTSADGEEWAIVLWDWSNPTKPIV